MTSVVTTKRLVPLPPIRHHGAKMCLEESAVIRNAQMHQFMHDHIIARARG